MNGDASEFSTGRGEWSRKRGKRKLINWNYPSFLITFSVSSTSPLKTKAKISLFAFPQWTGNLLTSYRASSPQAFNLIYFPRAFLRLTWFWWTSHQTFEWMADVIPQKSRATNGWRLPAGDIFRCWWCKHDSPFFKTEHNDRNSFPSLFVSLNWKRFITPNRQIPHFSLFSKCHQRSI